MKAMKVMKATKASAAAGTSEDACLPCHESGLRGLVMSSSALTRRPQTPGLTDVMLNDRSDCPTSPESDDDTISLHSEVSANLAHTHLLRGGGKGKQQPKKKKKTQPSKTQEPKGHQRALKEELCANHWSVPVCREDELEYGKDGIALVSKSAYLTKSPVLANPPFATAMLVHPQVEASKQADGSEWPVITVWVTRDGQILQQTRRLVQCGTRKVACNPPVAKGQAPKTQAMCTIVLEVVRSAFANEQDWQRAATNASCAMQQYLTEHVSNTEWSDHKIKKCIPLTREGKTNAIAAYVRLPTSLAVPLIKHSGTQASMVFARYYTSKDCTDKTPKLVNLWLKVEVLQQAKQKYLALPQNKVQGLAWSPKGFAVRVLEEDAAAIAPLATDMPYTAGDRYEIAGVPRDWSPVELFTSLATTDTPWPDIANAKLLFRKGRGDYQKWVIKAPQPPTAVVVFLDQYALAIKKEEPTPCAMPKPHGMQAPTAGTWAQALGEHMEVEESETPSPTHNASHAHAAPAQATAPQIEVAAPAQATAPQIEVPTPAPPSHARSRSPVPTQRNSQPPLREEVDGLKAQMSQLMLMMQQLLANQNATATPPPQA
ncbi:unnamed protein product [Symbiodinium sp. CCMP2456]|nr:unnamed protein product [Symbiodinium sp. CCMP2456]